MYYIIILEKLPAFFGYSMHILKFTTKFTKEYIAKDAPGGKEHVGYIVDRVGFHEFKKWALDGVKLGEKAIVKENVYWGGIHYNSIDNQ